MDPRLNSLINEYLQAVRAALTLMQKSGIKLPHTSNEWVKTDLANVAKLSGDIEYQRHGYGCWVNLPDGPVDFDFGSLGEISGLDVWRLGRFAKERKENYGFATDEDLQECFNEAIKKRIIIPLATNLYRIANEQTEYASSIDSRNSGDLLPHRDLDDILTLQIHYFYSAELMLEHYDSIVEEWRQDGKLSRETEINLRIYMSSWLGFLAVTCEGFRKLNMFLLLNNKRPDDFQGLIPKCNELNSSIKTHYDDLRKFRNNVFHLRSSANDTVAFLTPDADRLSWARSIHNDLKSFFSDYRVACECHYMLNGRRSESDLS